MDNTMKRPVLVDQRNRKLLYINTFLLFQFKSVGLSGEQVFRLKFLTPSM
jgi:hypothetical protein